MNYSYKSIIPKATDRKKESSALLSKFPDRIPVILEKDPRSDLKEMKPNLIISRELSVSQLTFLIRTKIQLSKDSALFLLVSGKYNIVGEMLMGDIYERYKDPEDGFLYITYASELSWGS